MADYGNYPSYTQAPLVTGSASVSVAPYATTSITGTFSVDSFGVRQGVAIDNPTYRNMLCSGFVDKSETKPLYGGLPIVAEIALAKDNGLQKRFPQKIKRATTIDETTGFSVINQSPNMIITAGSDCPTIGAPGTINYYRLGSGALIALPVSPQLVGQAAGQPERQYVTWDFTSNCLAPATAPSTTASSQSVDDSGNTKAATKATLTKAAATNPSSIVVSIKKVFPTGGYVVYEDSSGNVTWRPCGDNYHYLAVVQI